MKFNSFFSWRKDIWKWEWNHWLGPCHWVFIDFILLALGFCGQSLGLELTRTRLDFQFRKITVSKCEECCVKYGEHRRWQRDLWSDPEKILWLPKCGELQWKGREVNTFDRYLGDKRDGNWWTGSTEKKDTVWDGTHIFRLNARMDSRYKHSGVFGRRKKMISEMGVQFAPYCCWNASGNPVKDVQKAVELRFLNLWVGI